MFCPPDAILYAELSEPGQNLGALLSQLGLLGRASQTGRFGISPDLVQGLLGIEGAALAVTAFPAGGAGLPSGVLVLHPGDLLALRGMMVSLLSAKGLPAEAIEGYATWAVPVEPGFEVLVTLTERLVIASNDVFEIGAVIERMRGDDEDTLANNEDLQVALRSRQGALLSVCVNAQPVMPLLRSLAAEESKRDPDLSLALALVDLPSLQSIGAFVAADAEGLGLEVELGLREGHRNLVFDSPRLPNVQRETLALVPQGAAFALATALNPQADVAPLGTDSVGRPIVTLLDVGRELFANVIDVALFGLSDGDAGGGLPEVALVICSNDAQRTAAMLDLVLGLATQVTSRATSSDPSAMGETAGGDTIAGVEPTLFMSVRSSALHLARGARTCDFRTEARPLVTVSNENHRRLASSCATGRMGCAGADARE